MSPKVSTSLINILVRTTPNLAIDRNLQGLLFHIWQIFLYIFDKSISTNAKLNYYAIFKTEFICEKYLFVIENYILKILMTKLRLGILNLEVVLGRYEGIPREERFCKLCDSGLVEHEMHFVLVCNYFMNERQSFIPRY